MNFAVISIEPLQVVLLIKYYCCDDNHMGSKVFFVVYILSVVYNNGKYKKVGRMIWRELLFNESLDEK